jgi:uncharacterized membrane protein (GlpM family)
LGVEAIQALFVVATSASLSRGDKLIPVGGVMSFAGISELIDQSLVVRVELEALSFVMAVLSCMAIIAFIAYLVSIFYLWFTEGKGGRKIYERGE